MFKMKRRSALLIQASVLAGAVAFTGWASAQTQAPYPSAGPITLVGGLEKITGCLGRSFAVSSALALSATCST